MAGRPNILLVMSDQEQHWSLTPKGLSRPGLNWIREHGIGFTRYHVVTLPCGPSRSTIYTGQHTPKTGLFDNPSRARGNGMSPDVATIGGMLREHGYYTAYKGKWHVSTIDPPVRFSESTIHALEEFGFSEYTCDGDPVGIVWDGYRQDPAIASDAANWLTCRSGRKPSDRPWFLAVNFVNPHDVMFFDATGRMNDDAPGELPWLPAPCAPLYDTEWDVALPDSFGDDLNAKPAVHEASRRSARRQFGFVGSDDEPAWRRLRTYYYNCLRDLDQHVATVVSALVRSGHDRDTVVLYSTDHGEAAGAHGLRGKPTSLYREVVNVPLVIAHPDVNGGAETEALSSAVDLAPTILSLAGVAAERRQESHPALRGHDLSGVIQDPASGGPRGSSGVLFCTSRPVAAGRGDADQPLPRSSLRGIFDGRWKLGRYFRGDDHRTPLEWPELSERNDLELYDTVADPHELVNLAGSPEHRATLVGLARRMAMLSEVEIGGPLARRFAGNAAQRSLRMVAI